MPRRSYGGRPAKDPENKVGQSVRCLVTLGVRDALVEDAKRLGIPMPRRGSVPSDILRVAIYERLQRTGLLEEFELDEDATFEGLERLGII